MKLINWKTKEVIYESDVESKRELVEEAINKGISLVYADLSYVDLSYVDLSYVDLSYVDLIGTNLTYADLTNASLYKAKLTYADLTNTNLTDTKINYTIGNRKEIKTILNTKYHITYTKDQLAIGCKQYSINEWKSFNDKDIIEMDGKKGLEWWKEWKDWLFMTIDKSF